MLIGRAFTYMFGDPVWHRHALFGSIPLILSSVVTLATAGRFASTAGNLIAVFGSLVVWAHYAQIVPRMAREGADLPLPRPSTFAEAIERTILVGIYGALLVITMLPLLLCAFCTVSIYLISASTGDAFGSRTELSRGEWVILAPVVMILLFPLLVYMAIGTTQFVTTDRMLASVNPASIFRLFREQPSAWLLEAAIAIVVAALTYGVARGISATIDNRVAGGMLAAVATGPITL